MTITVAEALQRAKDAADADAAGHPAAHAQLLDAIHDLNMAAEKPAERTMRMRFQMLENLCIRIALEYGVLQAVAARKGASVTAAELSKQTGADELLIIRIMRKVTYVGVCEETGYASYASNDTTTHITQKGFIGGEKHHTDFTFPVGSKLVEMIRKNELYQFPDGPDEKGPFEYTFDKPIFDYLHEDAEQKEAFDDYMTARRDPNTPQWFETYPAAQELAHGLRSDSAAALVVDVGGGAGHEIAKFRDAFPGLPGRLVLQDLPMTLDGIASKPEGVECASHDFFTEQPIKGARIYFLRNILHDWPDHRCAEILSQIVKAMDPEYSRVLIDDYVLPDTQVGSRAASMDILMWLFANGMERSRHQWDQLLESVKLEIVQVWTSPTGTESVLEARVRRSE